MILVLLSVLCVPFATSQHFQAQTNDVFMIPLAPLSFNISDLGSEGAYSYTASLHDLPDLPKWIQLVYNPILKLGFLFGTPPPDVSSVKLDVVASNQFTFESPSKVITLDVFPNPDPLNSEVKMKIHNLNVEDLMDDSKRNRLLDVFREVLWPESAQDIHLVELQSAVAAGGRRPARRQDGEGVILTLGSQIDFSEMLRDLEREVSPLWAFRNCPRDFKKTSAERHFRSKGFIMDWCSFKLLPQNTSLVSPTSPSTEFESKTERPPLYNRHPLDIDNIWRSPQKSEIPVRSYVEEGITAIFVPLVLLLILAALLTAILGVHPEGSEAEEGQLYEVAFEELPFVKSKKDITAGTATRASSCAPSEFSQQLRASVPRTINTMGRNAIESNSASLGRGTNRRHPLYGPTVMESVTRGSSPFLMSSASPSPTPVSTLSRSAYRTGSRPGTIGRAGSEQPGTLGRPRPPPYASMLPK